MNIGDIKRLFVKYGVFTEVFSQSKIIEFINPFFWEQVYIYARNLDLVDNQNYKEAKVSLTGFIKRKAKVTDIIHYIVGIAYLGLKEYSMAVSHFSQSIEQNPKENLFKSNSLFYMALTYYESKDYEKAIDFFLKSIVIKEKNRIVKDKLISLPYLYCYVGRAYMNMGNVEKAMAEFNKGLELEPDNPALQRDMTILKDAESGVIESDEINLDGKTVDDLPQEQLQESVEDSAQDPSHDLSEDNKE